MLKFVLGEKGSGKTTAVHKILGQAVSDGKKTMLIVPKQFTFQSDKGVLELLGARLACEVEVLSFSRLASLVLQRYGGITEPLLKDGPRSVVMSLAIEALSEQLSVFSRHKNEIALTEKMLDTLDEMKKDGVSFAHLERLALKTTDKLLSEKLRETALILRAYDALTYERYFDDADLLAFVADKLKGTDFFSGKVVALDGFSSFTNPECDIIRSMMKSADDVYVSLCCDDIFSTDILSPFALCRSTARNLAALASREGVLVGDSVRCIRSEEDFAAPLFHLAHELYKPGFTPFEGNCDCVTVKSSPNVLYECDYVAREIKRLIRTEKCRCRDITVIYRDEDIYERPLRNALFRYDVPLFEDKRQSIEFQPLVFFVSTLLLISAQGFSSDLIFRLLKTGLTGISEEDIALIENYCFMWDINGNKWLSLFTENPDGLGESFTDESKQILSHINVIRNAVIEPLSFFRQNLKDKSSKEACALIYNFLRDNGIDENLKGYAVSLEEGGLVELALEQEQVWDLLMEALDELACAADEKVISPMRLYELFTLLMREKTLGKLPDGFDEVILCSAGRATTKNSPVVFVMGLGSGVFPASVKDSGIFTLREKDSFRKDGVTLGEDVKQMTQRERFLLYNALCACTRELHLSYAVTGSGGEKISESEGIRLVRDILPSVSVIGDESDLDLVESEQSAFELMARRFNENSPFVLSLKEYFGGKAEYKSRLEALERAVYSKDFAFNDSKNAMALFGEDMAFSASKLEDYGKCPFLFFCRYGLKAKPRLKAKLDAAQSGTVIHYILENILKNHKGKTLTLLSDEELQNEIAALLRHYMSENMGDDESKSERFSYLYYRTQKILDFIMLRLKAEFLDSDFEPCAFEFKIAKGCEVEPMVYKLKSGTAQLYGYIDRVDFFDGENGRYVRIVDYKSGEKKFRLNDVLSGMNMQMLLYLVSIWRNGKGFYESIIPSGVLYFPARLSPFEGERGDDGEKKLKNRLATAKMSGMLISDGDVISHMEKSLKGMFIPASFDEKKGVLKGDFITVKQLEKLSERMDEIICDMGNSLHEGKVPARPVCGGSYTDVCSWCDYGDICMKEDPGKRYIINKKHDECIRELMGGEDGGKKLDSGTD